MGEEEITTTTTTTNDKKRGEATVRNKRLYLDMIASMAVRVITATTNYYYNYNNQNNSSSFFYSYLGPPPPYLPTGPNFKSVVLIHRPLEYCRSDVCLSRFT